MKKFDYIIIGSGIVGCSLAYFLKKHSNSVLLIDKNSDVCLGASGAAGAFLSPLLGIDNSFKDLVNKALKFSTSFYNNNFPKSFVQAGTIRIPKNKIDKEKFESYIPYMSFPFEEKEGGYYFPVGSTIKPEDICKELSFDIEKLFNYDVKSIKESENSWILNDEIKARKLFLCTGANLSLINEEYFKLRAVWGQKIDILSSTEIFNNYHKECSISKSIEENGKYKISIGATHNRFEDDMSDSSFNLGLKDINYIKHNEKTLEIIQNDTKKLLERANDILTLKEIELINVKIGARASSVDYFPMVGALINSKKSFEVYPHIKKGAFIKDEQLILYKNLYTLNGVGGRGFVLAPYLAKVLSEFIINGSEIEKDVLNFRLFKRWARKEGKSL
ncbi:FAD-dependent oxidoreductase [Aliarcobacter trophiarum]|uniref:FAD-dependent oxidoreductase n=1 Tax=Aliarcobacter trophiarum TaxID=708186 RepID=UPI00100B56D7|nr:FAD-dependent oxidoreductase [Aliarcobacter trophiarum]RXI25093.1 D-amino-acid oxidase [Aliarcobacter trophiarum]